MGVMMPRVGFAAAAAALLLSTAGTFGAGGTITGTVTVSGATSNADAVVYVVQAPVGSPPGKPVGMDQRKMQFVPHVLPIVAGTTVEFLNSDPTAHNVFSPDNEKYNLGTWPQGQTKSYAFTKCTKFPCVYTQLCRVHPEMEGFIVVLQNPYFAVTTRDGKYEIKDVPPGSHQLGVWHEKGKAAAQPVSVDASKPAVVDFTLKK
jgi:plastocyanin